MNVVPLTRPVVSAMVITEDIKVGPSSTSNLGHVGHQIFGSASQIFSNVARRVSAYRIEISKKNC